MRDNNQRPGTILKIKLTDFVSYSSLSFKPSNLVNVFLAPNGAGKSSLLSAIILGLGGKPNIIGKSNQIQEFIMFGKQEAKIRIDLCDPEESNGVLSVRRCIKDKGQSTWILNNKKVGLKEIEETMARLNIQIDSLCQVLPQERVQDFAKMNPIELLENVQKVIGGNLFINYTKLLELRVTLGELSTEIDKKTVSHRHEVEKYTRLEKDVEAINEKKKVLKSVTYCKQKLAWMLFMEKKQEQDKIAEGLIDSRKKLDNFEKNLEPLKKSIHTLNTKLASLNGVVTNKNSSVNFDKDKVKKSVNNIRMTFDQIENIKSTLHRKISNASDLPELIARQENIIKESSQLIANNNISELTSQIKEIDNEIRAKSNDLVSLSKEEDNIKIKQKNLNNNLIRLEHEKERANSVSKKKLDMISSSNSDVYKAYTWLNKNSDQFQSKVYGPVLLDLAISQPQGAKYVEFIINHRDLISFVTETSQDMNNLLSLLRTRDRLVINCAHCNPPQRDLSEMFPPDVPLHQLRSFGFDCYVIDLLNGPPTVLAHLCKLYKLHLIPVAFNSRNVKKDELKRFSKITRYFIGDEFHVIRRSKYSGEVSSSVKAVKAARLLADSVDKELIRKIQKEIIPLREALSDLEEEKVNIEENTKGIQAEVNDLRNKKKTISSNVELYRKTTVRLHKAQEEFRNLQNSMVDIEKEEKEAQAKIKGIITTNVSKFLEVLQWSKSYSEDVVACKLAAIDCDAVKLLKDEKANQLSQFEKDKRELVSKFDELKKCLHHLKAEATVLLNKAKEATDGLVMDDERFKQLYSKAFDRLPNDIDAIKNKIQSFEAKAKCLNNPLQEQHLREYETAKELADKLQTELQELADCLSSSRENFDSVFQNWLPEINNVVQHVNSNFSRFFQKIKCVGEVGLSKGENQEAVEKFGLEIRVKFRDNTELQILDQFVQSGGERALTTAVFLLSLQRLSTVPFRCVDEINQGMDKFNERRVYNLLFNTISDSSSQYFLLTPKFLSNVPFPRLCTIYNVYNAHDIVYNTRDTVHNPLRNLNSKHNIMPQPGDAITTLKKKLNNNNKENNDRVKRQRV